ncbi:hypothetical protein KAW48_08015 [candidate division WOR-3 bacterium]|nr:hypothetical protein [candidate division WOR-3 bacterium]
MKRFLLPFVFILLFISIGCGKDAVEVIEPPTNLAIASADGLDITLGWTESSTQDIDGYIVFLDTNIIDTVGTVAQATVTPNALGTFSLRAYKGDNRSDASGGVTTGVKTETGQTIYNYDISGQPSGYGWDEDGNGTVYNFVQEDSLVIDIYLDSEFDLASPDTWTKYNTPYNTSYIQGVSSDVAVAPATGYVKGAYAYKDSIYVVKLPSHGPGNEAQYLKLKLTNVNTIDSLVTFEYTFQPFEGYRRFK